MENPVKAKLFSVSGAADQPEDGDGFTVMFNPTSLKFTLANTIAPPGREQSTRATQYVDKSSSTLAVDLIFDTSASLTPTNGEAKPADDVRKLTGEIARKFMQTDPAAAEEGAAPASGDNDAPRATPRRCLFVWGTFSFVGIMESFDETIDFFSPEGTPLRATLAIKLSESRFQFTTSEAQAASRASPKLGSLGQDQKNWRDTSMFNGLESPRLSLGASVSLPGVSASASLNAGAGGFSAGASSSLGSAIPGAFSAPSLNIKAPSFSASSGSSSGASFKASAGLGFD